MVALGDKDQFSRELGRERKTGTDIERCETCAICIEGLVIEIGKLLCDCIDICHDFEEERVGLSLRVRCCRLDYSVLSLSHANITSTEVGWRLQHQIPNQSFDQQCDENHPLRTSFLLSDPAQAAAQVAVTPTMPTTPPTPTTIPLLLLPPVQSPLAVTATASTAHTYHHYSQPTYSPPHFHQHQRPHHHPMSHHPHPPLPSQHPAHPAPPHPPIRSSPLSITHNNSSRHS